MVFAATTSDKKALAHSLARHDKEMLEDFKHLTKVFGPMKGVGYESDNPATQAKIELDLCEARLRAERAKVSEARESIEKAREALR